MVAPACWWARELSLWKKSAACSRQGCGSALSLPMQCLKYGNSLSKAVSNGSSALSNSPTSMATSWSSPPPILPRSMQPSTRAPSRAASWPTAWTTLPTAISISAPWSAAANCKLPSRRPERVLPSRSVCAARSTSSCRKTSAAGLKIWAGCAAKCWQSNRAASRAGGCCINWRSVRYAKRRPAPRANWPSRR